MDFYVIKLATLFLDCSTLFSFNSASQVNIILGKKPTNLPSFFNFLPYVRSLKQQLVCVLYDYEAKTEVPWKLLLISFRYNLIKSSIY